MKTKNIITGLLLFTSSIAYAQIDLELLDVAKEWYHVHQDTTLPSLQDTFTNINSEITGYETLRKAYTLSDDFLIELFTTGINFGSYVTCTNAVTGEFVWKNSYNLTNDDKIEIDLNLYTRSDGNLEISGMRLLDPNVPNIFPFGIATRKIIDIQTGQLISKIYQDFIDGGCVCNNSNGQLGRTLPILEDSLYMTVCTYPSVDGQQIQILQNLDNDGRVIDTLSFIANPLMDNNIQSHKLISFNKLDENRFLIGSGSTSNPLDTNLTITELFFINNEGQLLLRKDISSLINYSPSFQQEFKNDKVFITTVAYNNETAEPNDVSYSLLILDNGGNELYNDPGYIILDNEEVGLLKLAQINDNTYLLLGAKENCLKYFTLEDSNAIKHLKTICYSDSTWNLSPMFIELNENGGIVNGVRWSKEDEESDFEVTFAINADEILMKTSNTDLKTKLNSKFNLYPNPTRDFVNVKFNGPTSGVIQIISSKGIKMKEVKIESQTELQLDVSAFAESYYIIKLISQNVSTENRFIKLN